MSETKKDRRRAAENPMIKEYMANLVPQREDSAGASNEKARQQHSQSLIRKECKNI